MNRISKVLLLASIALLLTGVGLAVAQPGSLGDDDAEKTDEVAFQDSSTTAAPSTSATVPPTSTGVTAPPGTLPVASTDPADPTVATPDVTTTSPAVDSGSGLASEGAAEPQDTADGLASTGGTSMILVGVLLGAGAFAFRRRTAVAI